MESKKKTTTLIWAFLSLGFLLRYFSVYYVTVADRLYTDMEYLNDIAGMILKNIWVPTHFFQSVGFALVLSAFRSHFTDWGEILRIVQVFLSTLTLFFLYLTVRGEFGRRVALISLAVGALHVPWILFPNYALPECLFTFFLSLCAYAGHKLVRKPEVLWALLWGGAFTAAFWLKGLHVFMGPLLFLTLLLKRRLRAMPSLISIGIVFCLGLATHAALSYFTVGKIYLSARAGGLNFVEGKCPHKINVDPSGRYWQSPLYVSLGKNETKYWNKPFSDSGYFFEQGLECVKKSPFVLIQSLEGVPYLFFGNDMWPFNKIVRSPEVANRIRLMEVLFALFLVGGLALYVKNIVPHSDLDHLIVWIVPLASLFLCVYIFKSEIRYRAPFDIWFIPLAVRGWIGYSH